MLTKLRTSDMQLEHCVLIKAPVEFRCPQAPTLGALKP